MRKYLTLFIILVIFCCFRALGQSSGNNYLAQPNLKKFEGKWQFSNDTITLTLQLYKEKVHINRGNNNFYIDLVQGKYSLIKKGKVISDLNSQDVTITSGSLENQNDPYTLHFIFTDVGKYSKRCNVTFKLSPNQLGKAEWLLTNTEHVIVGDEKFDLTFSVPTSMILKKVL
ncbi:DUF6705 family protein [Mucilaginibacter litoreus]|uniref:DUF6705 family protein n=1 Tax=Mucilaginibacter litoreus TaxID=1048221 RepID=A0ABW3AW30_9SPHI